MGDTKGKKKEREKKINKEEREKMKYIYIYIYILYSFEATVKWHTTIAWLLNFLDLAILM